MLFDSAKAPGFGVSLRSLSSGEVPPELGKCRELEWFQAKGNRLTGVVPEELGQLSALQVMDLSENQLSGRIPQGTAPTLL